MEAPNPRQTEPAPWTDEHVRRLVNEHEGPLRAYLVAIGCPHDAVDDVAQDAFLSVISSARGPHEHAVGSYLRVTARNVFLKSRRGRTVTYGTEVEAIDRAWSDVVGTDEAAWLDALEACLETVTPRAREALRLRYQEGVRRDEVARRLGLGEPGVKSLLHRAKEMIRDCVRRRTGP